MRYTITLELDELDYNTIQKEIARSQSCRIDGQHILPEHDSNLPGVIIAEAIRSLEEYRAMYEAEEL